MKKIFISILSLLLFFTACDDRLDLNPYDGLVVETVFDNEDGFTNAIRGVYGGFLANGFYGENTGILISGEVLSDNVTQKLDGRGTLSALWEWRNGPNDDGFGSYGQGYRIISRANAILDNIDRINPSDFRNNIEGEALALRAIAHFEIVRVYSKIPTQSADANDALGIYYATSFNPDIKTRRLGTTVKMVYDQMIDDLEKAYDLINALNPNGRLTKAAVAGMLSRVYLYMGDYDKVIEWADASLADNDQIAPPNRLLDVWQDAYDDNVLFKILVIDNDNHRPGVPYSQTGGAGTRSEFVCSFELFNLFDDTDARKEASVFQGTYGGNVYNHVRKYLGRATGDATVIDGKYLRVEEVVLNKAEAQFRSNNHNDENALATLDLLRDQRYDGFTSGNETGQDLLDAILLERRLELAFEGGDRFFTLKRLGLDLERSEHGDYADGTGNIPQILSYPADGFRWQQPIPQGAIDANPLLLEDQNPGY